MKNFSLGGRRRQCSVVYNKATGVMGEDVCGPCCPCFFFYELVSSPSGTRMALTGQETELKSGLSLAVFLETE